MKVQIYTVNGEEFTYDFKPEISFQSHIKNLHENLVHNDQLKKLIQLQWGNDIDISPHYGIQESASAQWIDNSQEPLLNQENTLYFKLKPLNLYIQQVEKYLPNNNNNTTTTTSNNPKNLIETQIHSQISQPQSIQMLNSSIDKLHIHLALLMFEDKSNLFVSSNIIKRIIKIVFLYPTLNSLNLLVFFLSNSNNTNLENNNNNNNNNTGNNSPVIGKKNDGTSTPIRSNSVTNKPSTSSLRLNDSGSGTESISLFTLIDTCIKELSREFNSNFYLFILEDRAIQSNNNTVPLTIAANNNIKFEIICQALKIINNMYRLSPNPVLYTSRLHQELVFKRIIEIREREPKLSQNPQYIVLRSNLMKELHLQRLQQINPDKIQHQILLSDLWTSSIPNHPYTGIYSNHWLSLGFRGPNPIEDFKVTGVLALRNIAYFSKNYTNSFQHILMTQTKREDLTSKSSLNISSVVLSQDQNTTTIPTNITTPPTPISTVTKSRSYPLAVACISLTYTLSNIFRIGRESSPDASLWDISLCDTNWFDECFITTVNLFESLWHSEAHSYSDFPQVISHARYIIEKVCSDSPKSIQEFKDKLDNILEKKTPIGFDVSSDLLARYHQLQPSNTSKRHIHKIFGERIDIDIVPNQTSDDIHSNVNGDLESPRKNSKSLSISIPNSNNNNNEIGDGPISPTNFSYKRLIKFFGERVNSRSVQFSPQPSNVKAYKLKNFFGEGAVIISRDEQQQQTLSTSPNPLPQPVEDEIEEDESSSHSPIIPMTERSHRLHVFFGEWFDTEQVEYNEKIRISTSPELSPPTSPTLKSQPENTRIHKLNKFFGERVNVPINSKSKIIGEGGGGGIFPIDDIDDHNELNWPVQNNNNVNLARSPEETRSDFKAQKLLGERLDIKKEKEALNFAPQPQHIREYKLHKLFGEMIPSSKVGGPWKKGSIIKGSNRNVTSNNVPPIHTITSAPTSPRENEFLDGMSTPISPKSENGILSQSPPIHSTSLPSSPRHGIENSTYSSNNHLHLPTNPLTHSVSESTSPQSISPQMLLPKPFEDQNTTNTTSFDSNLVNTFGGNNNNTTTLESSTDKNIPHSNRESLNSGSSSLPGTFGSTHYKLEKADDSQTTFEQDGVVEEEEEENENPNLKQVMNDKKKNHRLHVFFGERFDVEGEGYHSRLSGSFSSSGSPGAQLSTSLPSQPGNVKNHFKLKKFFGKSPDTENGGSNNSSAIDIHRDNSINKSISEDDFNDNLNHKNSNNNNNNSNKINTTETKQLRRDFKAQKILGERIDIKKEKEYSSFKDQPSTVKVEKLIGLFGEKVSFNLKRRESLPTLPRPIQNNSTSTSNNTSIPNSPTKSSN